MNQLISDIEMELKTVKIKDNKSVFFNKEFYFKDETIKINPDL